jgi:CHAT domain-containing protein
VARLAQQLDTTLTNLEARYQQIRLARQFAENEPAAPEFTLAVQRIEQLEENAQTLIQSLQQARPAFAPLIGRRPDLLTTLQAQLGAALLLQFYCVRGEIHLFVADHTGIRIQSRLGLAQPVEAALTAFQGTIRRTLQLAQKKGLSACAQQLPTLLAATNRHLNTLYEHLLAPVMALLPANRPLIILPADNLAKVPFHALYNGSHYLLEERVVSSAPSATVLQLSLRPSSLRGQLLMAYNAGDLPAATAEVRTLQQLLPLATVVSDGQATPQFFLEHAPSQQLIHLASHAGFRPDNPMLSWLELAGRRLTLAEVARLHLDAELVVLSGCDTGQAQTRGADLLSLAAGFLGAGARSLLVSLWRVEDQVTTELMTQFYRALLAGQPRSTALQSAGLAILQRARRATDEQISYAHPAFWAPFHLIGCWQPINLTV